MAAPIEVEATALRWEDDETSRALLGQINIVSAHEWTATDARFGGFSGLLIDDGQLRAVTDRGSMLTGKLHKGGLIEADFSPLVDTQGAPLKEKADADAESLARTEDGGYLVSFERHHRILAYKDGPALPFALPDDVAATTGNHGLEALTRLADGRYLMILEKSGADSHSKGWIGRPGAWQTIKYLRNDEYRPTGATTLPNGSVLILERYYSVIVGVRARLRLVDKNELIAGGTLIGTHLGEIRAPLPVDNFEGIATTQDKDGQLLVHLLSDDNFSILQKTIYLTLRLRNLR